MAVDAIVIAKEVTGLLTEGHGFSQLLDDPRHGRVVGDPVVKNLASGVI